LQILAAVTRHAERPPTIETLELDAPRAGEVLVEIVASGICHTDLFAPRMYPLPAVLGHEGAGVVVSVGSAVAKFRPGDRVAMTFGSCGACMLCNTGSPAYCAHGSRLQFGGGRDDGSKTLRDAQGPITGSFFQQSSFASHALGTERNVVRLPDGIPLEIAAPLGCGIQTGAGAVFNNLRVGRGASIAVFGVGSVGLAAVMAARLAGAERIIAVDVHGARLALARELGATHVIDANCEQVVEAIRASTQGGADYSIETAGQVSSLEAAIECLRSKGVCALVTVPQMGAKYPMTLLPLLLGGKSIVSVLEGDSVPDEFIPRLANLYLSGDLPIDRLITEYPFTSIERALGDAASGAAIKPVLRMD
jgi:aryl-alcohol dehydrogenase